MDKQELRMRIAKLRLRENLSARKLSLKLKRSPGYISKIEQGEFFPDIDELSAIAQICHSSLEELFYFDFDSYKLDKDCLKLIKKLNAKQKEMVTGFISSFLNV